MPENDFKLWRVEARERTREESPGSWEDAEARNIPELHVAILDLLANLGGVALITRRPHELQSHWVVWARDAESARLIVDGTPLAAFGLVQVVEIEELQMQYLAPALQNALKSPRRAEMLDLYSQSIKDPEFNAVQTAGQVSPSHRPLLFYLQAISTMNQAFKSPDQPELKAQGEKQLATLHRMLRAETSAINPENAIREARRYVSDQHASAEDL